MSKADGKCSKCNGTGFVSSPRLHMGAPGCCFRCNGAGTYEAAAAVLAETKANNARARREREVSGPVMAKVFERMHARDSVALRGFEVRQQVAAMLRARPMTTTAEVAEALDCSLKVAFDTLCTCYPAFAYPVFDFDAGKAVGWSAGC